MDELNPTPCALSIVDEAEQTIEALINDAFSYTDRIDVVKLLQRMIVEIKGPAPYATWRDAAVAERTHRVMLERNLATLKAEGKL